MTTLIHRRGFLTASLGLIASPAIVRATSLMPIKAFLGEELYPFPFIPPRTPNMILTIDAITRELIKVWTTDNQFMHEAREDLKFFEGKQWDSIGDLRIRLPGKPNVS